MSIYFWKPHQNDGYLGNWYPSPFTVDNKNFLNSEHYFMWKKVMLFEPTREAEILAAVDPKTMKAVGQSVKNYNDEIWSEKRYEVMKEALFHKFSQNPKLLKSLMWTGEAQLVEASPVDRIWGIGITVVEALMDKPWRGQNLLGKALMETRERFVATNGPIFSLNKDMIY
jgi:ribA/ribD-fused uncharacterized protein